MDDDDLLRNTVLSAENGVKAFELVKTNKLNLVVSDMRMPGGDGMRLLEQIRAYDPTIPNVIFVTGFADVTAEECIAKGAFKVISKPYDRKDLFNAVFAALAITAQSKAD
jgi:CheY-like chemotaxis protein